MSKVSCYVAVDKDGTEKISNNSMFRRKRLSGQKVTGVFWGLFHGFYKKNVYNKWADSFCSNEDDFLPFGGVTLPKGSVEKLIGKKLTWLDEAQEVVLNIDDDKL